MDESTDRGTLKLKRDTAQVAGAEAGAADSAGPAGPLLGLAPPPAKKTSTMVAAIAALVAVLACGALVIVQARENSFYQAPPRPAFPRVTPGMPPGFPE